jgi:hypothetical protein
MKKKKDKDMVGGYPYRVTVQPCNTIDGKRNDSVDIELRKLIDFGTAGNDWSETVFFSFENGIMRVTFPQTKEFQDKWLEIATNIINSRKRHHGD